MFGAATDPFFVACGTASSTQLSSLTSALGGGRCVDPLEPTLLTVLTLLSRLLCILMTLLRRGLPD
jgi:hypothetical protein